MIERGRIVIDRGPYLNDSGDIWVPIGKWSWNEAQHAALATAIDSGDECSRVRYLGKVLARLCDHEGWEDCTDPRHMQHAYHFQSYEGTWRS